MYLLNSSSQSFMRAITKDWGGKIHYVLIMNSQASRGDRKEILKSECGGLYCNKFIKLGSMLTESLFMGQVTVGQKKNLH